MKIEEKPGFFALVMSVLAGALGVQSENNRRRDFNTNSALPYIVGGVLFVIVFVLCLLGAVSLLLP